MAPAVEDLVRTHPGDFPIDKDRLVSALDRIYECAKACAVCADACLGEDDPKAQAACITSCQNCADICLATARALSRVTGFNPETVRRLVEACEQVCRLCREECASHADGMEHCRVCAEACQSCADACRSLLQDLGAR